MTRSAWLTFALLAVLFAGLTSRGQLAATVRQPRPNDVEQLLMIRENWTLGEISIEDLTSYLHKRLQIAVYLDLSAMQDEGVDPAKPVRFPNGNTSLATLLDLTFMAEGLDYLVQDNVLVITTKSKSEEFLFVRVYPVQDLVQWSDGALDYSNLLEMFQENTSGQWEYVDGVGGTMTPVHASESLVIRQTWRCHREITGILQAVRRARRLQNIPSLAAAPAPLDAGSFTEPAAIDVDVSPPVVRTFTDWRQPRVFGHD